MRKIHERALALLMAFIMVLSNVTGIVQTAHASELEETAPVVIETEAPAEEIETPVENTEAPVEETEIYDKILCDVPCSGIGILGRKPEIRYKDPKEFADLPEIQYGILENAAKLLKKGGTLVYSTCTLRQEENHLVTEKFLKAHPEFRIAALPESCGVFAGKHGEMTLLPHQYGTDGFYICRMQKTE